MWKFLRRLLWERDKIHLDPLPQRDKNLPDPPAKRNLTSPAKAGAWGWVKIGNAVEHREPRPQ